jgi:uncharacterized HAD superfamily protein
MKTKIIQEIRKTLISSQFLRETEDACASTTTLSYQSIKLPERHVWIETFKQFQIDLEDWNDDKNWDNSIIHFTTSDKFSLIKIAIAWLRGESIEYCKTLGGTILDIK